MSILIYNMVFSALISDCGDWPTIKNGDRVDRDVRLVSYEKFLILSAKYYCDEGYIYSRESSLVTCSDPSIKLDFGSCVKGTVVSACFKLFSLSDLLLIASKRKITKTNLKTIFFCFVKETI